MKCDGCGEDKTATVTWGIKLTRINPRNGDETIERRSRRLCAACGGGLRADDVDPAGDDAARMPLDGPPGAAS